MQQKEKKPREYRGVSDEIREQHQKTKNMTFKERLAYFWYYYKIHTIAVIAILIFGGMLIHDITSSKDYCFYGVMLNSILLSEDKLETTFAEYADLDTQTYDCTIDTSSTLSYDTMTEFDMATAQRLIALVQTKDLDAVVFDSVIYNNYASNGMFLDLRDFLTEQELSAYEGRIYYVDQAEIDAADEDANYENAGLISDQEGAALTQEDVQAEADSHKDPQSMKDPIPVGIFMKDSPFAVKSNAYGDKEPVFGVSATTLRLDTARKYLEFLWDDNVDFASMKEEALY